MIQEAEQAVEINLAVVKRRGNNGERAANLHLRELHFRMAELVTDSATRTSSYRKISRIMMGPGLVLSTKSWNLPVPPVEKGARCVVFNLAYQNPRLQETGFACHVSRLNQGLGHQGGEQSGRIAKVHTQSAIPAVLLKFI